jgi:hypothetical protein
MTTNDPTAIWFEHEFILDERDRRGCVDGEKVRIECVAFVAEDDVWVRIERAEHCYFWRKHFGQFHPLNDDGEAPRGIQFEELVRCYVDADTLVHDLSMRAVRLYDAERRRRYRVEATVAFASPVRRVA